MSSCDAKREAAPWCAQACQQTTLDGVLSCRRALPACTAPRLRLSRRGVDSNLDVDSDVCTQGPDAWPSPPLPPESSPRLCCSVTGDGETASQTCLHDCTRLGKYRDPRPITRSAHPGQKSMRTAATR